MYLNIFVTFYLYISVEINKNIYFFIIFYILKKYYIKPWNSWIVIKTSPLLIIIILIIMILFHSEVIRFLKTCILHTKNI